MQKHRRPCTSNTVKKLPLGFQQSCSSTVFLRIFTVTIKVLFSYISAHTPNNRVSDKKHTTRTIVLSARPNHIIPVTIIIFDYTHYTQSLSLSEFCKNSFITQSFHRYMIELFRKIDLPISVSVTADSFNNICLFHLFHYSVHCRVTYRKFTFDFLFCNIWISQKQGKYFFF